MSLPFVTIAIPTFNRASLLVDCVRRALAQSYAHFEVLVSDNASTDATPEILNEFRDPRLRVLRQATNIGPILNWNACLKDARGQYIVFVSDDDKIEPWLLERCERLLLAEPELPIIMALGDVCFAQDGRSSPEIASRRLQTGVWEGVDILKEYFRGRISPQGCTMMIRTERLRAEGGFPLDWPHSGDLAVTLPLLLSAKAGLVNERCGTYCVHAATQTSNLSVEARLMDLRKLVDLIIERTSESALGVARREEVQSEAKRYFARHAFRAIAGQRKEGLELTGAVTLLWRWRRDLMSLRITDDFVGIARSLVLLLLPRPITRVLRSSGRALSVR